MAESKDQFPPVKGGGSLILAWQVKNKHVLVIGGGEVSATKYTAKTFPICWAWCFM